MAVGWSARCLRQPPPTLFRPTRRVPRCCSASRRPAPSTPASERMARLCKRSPTVVPASAAMRRPFCRRATSWSSVTRGRGVALHPFHATKRNGHPRIRTSGARPVIQRNRNALHQLSDSTQPGNAVGVAEAIAPNGQIVIAGTAQTAYQAVAYQFPSLALTRLNANGSLDTTFGTAGPCSRTPVRASPSVAWRSNPTGRSSSSDRWRPYATRRAHGHAVQCQRLARHDLRRPRSRHNDDPRIWRFGDECEHRLRRSDRRCRARR